MGLWIPHVLDAMAYPQMDVLCEQPVLHFRHYDDFTRKEKVKFLAKGLLKDEKGGFPFGSPVQLGASLWNHWLNMQTAAPTAMTLTPSALGATVGRTFPFVLSMPMVVAQIYM